MIVLWSTTGELYLDSFPSTLIYPIGAKWGPSYAEAIGFDDLNVIENMNEYSITPVHFPWKSDEKNSTTPHGYHQSIASNQSKKLNIE